MSINEELAGMLAIIVRAEQVVGRVSRAVLRRLSGPAPIAVPALAGSGRRRR